MGAENNNCDAALAAAQRQVRRRKTGLTITVRLVPAGTLAPNTAHPLAYVPDDQRAAAAFKALGQLVERVQRAREERASVSPDQPLNSEQQSSTATKNKE